MIINVIKSKFHLEFSTSAKETIEGELHEFTWTHRELFTFSL